MSVRKRIFFALMLCCGLQHAQAAPKIAIVDAADERGTNWPSYGRSYSEQRYSPATQITPGNVRDLGLAWFADLPGIKSLEATPLMIDGMLYFSGNDSIVFAFEARDGKLKWKYDPEVWRQAGKRYRQLFPVNRGLAYWEGTLFVGTFDGRLIAINAADGKERWSVQTLEGETGFISGAPRTYKGKVIIGNGGAESGRSRGYASAYDAKTGKLIWRFYTVPGDPAKGFENPAMAMAAKTWTGEWWKYGGGGTVWNSITYDPQFNRVYLGTGNGSPWNRKVRSPGGGDNLFLSSIVALDADTGAYVWHYQTTPGESWDYTSAQDIVLADLNWQGEHRPVILHAPKNGFFYVIDRRDGKLLAADKLGTVTWADHVDLDTGRPVETPEARFPKGAGMLYPSSLGVHNWLPMSYSPKTGYVYVPTVEMPQYFSEKTVNLKAWMSRPFFYNTGYDELDVEAMKGSDTASLKISAALVAWDPISRRKAWEVPMPGLWNGGTLVTAGNLVFQGNAAGELVAYDATTGQKVWRFDAGLGINAAPISYTLDGRQYMAVLVGWGGTLAGTFGIGVQAHGWNYGSQPRRLLVFALNAKASLPTAAKPYIPQPIDDPQLVIDAAAATAGEKLFSTSCMLCHGFMAIAGGAAPDLRASKLALSAPAFQAVLKDGVLLSRGMPKFDDLSAQEINALYMYVRQCARADIAKAAIEPKSTAP